MLPNLQMRGCVGFKVRVRVRIRVRVSAEPADTRMRGGKRDTLRCDTTLVVTPSIQRIKIEPCGEDEMVIYM